MKRIELLDLRLRNFKGIREFVLNAGGADVSVFGDNAAGKTTLFDAFTWALFDKDSANKKDFGIKTLDPAGKPLHNLDHEVEISLLVGGRRTTLRKVFKEKWTKKRGSAISEFSGHTTEYFVDGVPVSKGEYDETVAGIVREDIFKLLTSPTYFNEELHWTDRRKILLEVCGDVTDAEVIASNSALAELEAILDGRDIEKHRAMIGARMKQINDELERIPVRIDEAQRSMPNLEGLDEGDLQRQIDTLTARADAKADELNRIRSGGEIAMKEKRLAEIEAQKLRIRNHAREAAMEATAEERRRLSTLRGQMSELKADIERNQREIERNQRDIASRKREVDELRAEWSAENAKVFEYCGDENCPTCGQALPADQVQAARARAEADYNQRKAERLASINQRGKTATAEARRIEELNATLTAERDRLENEHAAVYEAIMAAEDAVRAAERSAPDVSKDPAFIALEAEENRILDEMVVLRDQSKQAVQTAEAELVRIRNQISGLQAEKAKFDVARRTQARIAELEQQEKDLAAEYERLQKELFLTEEFIRTKVTMLESRINSKFKLARFKLFESQINGGLKEVCETTYNGVPYSGGLNNAARTNVGIDIINALSEHFGISAPIFIDNRESVVRLIETSSQVISLIVSAGDKTLRVETEPKTMKEAV